MMQIPGPTAPHEMRVCINGSPATYVLSCTCEEKRQSEPVCPVGAQESAGIAVGTRTYEIGLEQFTTGFHDGWLQQQDFELSVETGEEQLVFSGCEWIEIRRKITSGSDAVRAVRVAACSMERRRSCEG